MGLDLNHQSVLPTASAGDYNGLNHRKDETVEVTRVCRYKQVNDCISWSVLHSDIYIIRDLVISCVLRLSDPNLSEVVFGFNYCNGN